MGRPARVLDPAGGRGEFVNAIPAEERWLVDVVDHAERFVDPGVRVLVGQHLRRRSPRRSLRRRSSCRTCSSTLTRSRTRRRVPRSDAQDAGTGWRPRAHGTQLQVLRPRLLRLRRPPLALTHISVQEHLFAAGYDGDRGRFPVPAVLVPEPAAGVAAADPSLPADAACSGAVHGKQFLILASAGLTGPFGPFRRGRNAGSILFSRTDAAGATGWACRLDAMLRSSAAAAASACRSASPSPTPACSVALYDIDAARRRAWSRRARCRSSRPAPTSCSTRLLGAGPAAR